MTAVTQTEAFTKLDEGTVKDFIAKVHFLHLDLVQKIIFILYLIIYIYIVVIDLGKKKKIDLILLCYIIIIILVFS